MMTDADIQEWMKGSDRTTVDRRGAFSGGGLALYDKLGQGNVDELARLIERAEELELSALLVAAVDPRVHECIAILRGALKPFEDRQVT